jgi:hypothetical protein
MAMRLVYASLFALATGLTRVGRRLQAREQARARARVTIG